MATPKNTELQQKANTIEDRLVDSYAINEERDLQKLLLEVEELREQGYLDRDEYHAFISRNYFREVHRV